MTRCVRLYDALRQELPRGQGGGAESGGRTRMPLRAGDFKSPASTSFAIPARGNDRRTNEDALATGAARASLFGVGVFLEGSVTPSGRPKRASGTGELEADLQSVRALEARRMADVERVRIDVVIDTLGDFDIAIQELAEEVFGSFLLEDGRLGLQGTALLVTGIEMPWRGVTGRACGRQSWKQPRCCRYAAIYPKLGEGCQAGKFAQLERLFSLTHLAFGATRTRLLRPGRGLLGQSEGDPSGLRRTGVAPSRAAARVRGPLG